MKQKEQALESVEVGKKSKSVQSSASVPVRIKKQSKEKIDALLAKINHNRIGRKVRPDDLICFSLDLLTDNHLEAISTKLMSNKARLEALFMKMTKSRRGLTREEFIGMLLDGKLTV